MAQELRARLGDLEVIVLKGDITKIRADAIVNPANSLMMMGGGVAGAIKREGGGEIEREALSKAPVPVGRAIITGAGRLSAKFVVHAPTMERPAMRTSAEKVYLATRAALLSAAEAGAESVALPGMGTGVGGLDYALAARAMLRALGELRRLGPVKRVYLVALEDELFEAFASQLRRALKEREGSRAE
ncbi:MAG: O-acetyl-ADP-ribose deacetylase [Nitrososphaerota archaeon]